MLTREWRNKHSGRITLATATHCMGRQGRARNRQTAAAFSNEERKGWPTHVTTRNTILLSEYRISDRTQKLLSYLKQC